MLETTHEIQLTTSAVPRGVVSSSRLLDPVMDEDVVQAFLDCAGSINSAVSVAAKAQP